jgi:meiotic recombination protein SPO11
MSYDSASLTTPDIKWLGLRPSDLNKYDLPEQCRLDMTENDIKTGKELMKEEFIMKNPEWMKELEIMVRRVCVCVRSRVSTTRTYCQRFGTLTLVARLKVRTKKKAEIQALSSFGFQYITETYLPRKLLEGDWI